MFFTKKSLLPVVLGLVLAISSSLPHALSDEAVKAIRVFSLQYAQSKEAANLLERLLDSSELRIVSDERTNSVICMGKEGPLKVIEALLAKLDRPVDTKIAKPAPAEKRKVQQTKRQTTKPPTSKQHAPAVKSKPLQKSAAAAKAKPRANAKPSVVSPLSGRIDYVVKDGSRVREGELVARITLTTPVAQIEDRVSAELKRAMEAKNAQRRALAKEQHDLELAEMRGHLELAELQFVHHEAALELEQAELEAVVAAAEAGLVSVTKTLKILEQRVEAGTATEEDLPEAQAAHTQTRLELETAKRRLGFHVRFERPLKLALAKRELMAAKNALRKLELRSKHDEQQRAADQAAAKQKESLQKARWAKSEHRTVEIVAPTTGSVRLQGALRAGSLVRKGQPLLKLEPLW